MFTFKIIDIVLAAVMLIAVSCQGANKESVREKTAEETLAEPASDQILTNSVTDTRGNTLYMEFNNSRGTAAFTLCNDMILLKQDTMASGVRFSNEHYIYTEHQGKIRLTRDGKVVFEHQN